MFHYLPSNYNPSTFIDFGAITGLELQQLHFPKLQSESNPPTLFKLPVHPHHHPQRPHRLPRNSPRQPPATRNSCKHRPIACTNSVRARIPRQTLCCARKKIRSWDGSRHSTPWDAVLYCSLAAKVKWVSAAQSAVERDIADVSKLHLSSGDEFATELSPVELRNDTKVHGRGDGRAFNRGHTCKVRWRRSSSGDTWQLLLNRHRSCEDLWRRVYGHTSYNLFGWFLICDV